MDRFVYTMWLVFVCAATFWAVSASRDNSVTQPGRPTFCNNYDCPRFGIIKTYDNFELRNYDFQEKWVSVRTEGENYDTAFDGNFKQLNDYRKGENVEEMTIPLTVPMRTKGSVQADGTFMNDFVSSFYVPFAFQESPIKPTSSDLFIETETGLKVYVITFGGFAKGSDYVEKVKELHDLLDAQGLDYDTSRFYTAIYDAPFIIFNRHNEVWVPAQPIPALS